MTHCVSCKRSYEQKIYSKKPSRYQYDYHRAYHLKKKYNITAEDFKKLKDKQDGECAICGATQGSSQCKDVLFIDHCHETDKIRGLLCSDCNLALGLLRDNISLLDKAKEYLIKSKEI